MKKTLLALGLLATSLFGGEPYKALFDCSSGDMKFVASRIWLIQKTADQLLEEKEPYDFVVTIHSGCTPIVAADPSGYPEADRLEGIQMQMETLAEEYGVKFVACGIAAQRYALGKEDLLPFVTTVPNSITEAIRLQNQGYALIPFN